MSQPAPEPTQPIALSGECRCGRTVARTFADDQLGQSHHARLRCARCRRTVYATLGSRPDKTRDPAWVEVLADE